MTYLHDMPDGIVFVSACHHPMSYIRPSGLQWPWMTLKGHSCYWKFYRGPMFYSVILPSYRTMVRRSSQFTYSYCYTCIAFAAELWTKNIFKYGVFKFWWQ